MIKHHFVLLLRTITLYFSVVDQLRQKSVCQKMLEFLKYTCTENGYLISCFQNFGKVKNSNECRRRCDANNLYQLGVNDFYNFNERLYQTNFFIKAKDVSLIPDVTSDVLYRSECIGAETLSLNVWSSIHSTCSQYMWFGCERFLLKVNESLQLDAANDPSVVRKRGELDICTNIQFDFQKRTWTDHSVSDFEALTEKLETKKGFPSKLSIIPRIILFS